LVNGWAINREPTIVPFGPRSRLPLACSGKTACPIAQITRGYTAQQMTTVNPNNHTLLDTWRIMIFSPSDQSSGQ
jgi:hypothetical protein